MDAKELIRIQMDHAREWFAGTLDGVSDEQVHWTPPGIANPLGATYAHLIVSEDMIVNGMLKDAPPLFATSWSGRTGLSEPMPMPGPAWEDYGNWTRRVQVDMPALRRYAEAVYANTDAYIDSLGNGDLDRTLDLSQVGFGERTVGWVLTRLVVGHMDNECGEVSVLKGLQGMRGYPG